MAHTTDSTEITHPVGRYGIRYQGSELDHSVKLPDSNPSSKMPTGMSCTSWMYQPSMPGGWQHAFSTNIVSTSLPAHCDISLLILPIGLSWVPEISGGSPNGCGVIANPIKEGISDRLSIAAESARDSRPFWARRCWTVRNLQTGFAG